MNKVFIAALIVLAFAALGYAASQWQELGLGTPPSAAPADKESCEAQGGKWGPVGMAQTVICNLPTSDAGKPCTDSGQCESACIAPGQCYGWQNLIGTCLSRVESGETGAPICID